MVTNKKFTLPTQIIQPLTFPKKIPPPSKNLNYLKNQHPPPPQEKKQTPKSPRSGKIS